MIAAVTTFDSLYTKYCGRFIDPSELVRPFFYLTSIAIWNENMHGYLSADIIR